jgi:hypothetical protein
VVGRVTPEAEASFLDSVRGRTARAVEAVVRALRQAEGKHTETRDEEDGERVGMRIRFTRREKILWQAACESRAARGHCVPYREIDAFQAHAPGRVLKAATVRSGIERHVTATATRCQSLSPIHEAGN